MQPYLNYLPNSTKDNLHHHFDTRTRALLRFLSFYVERYFLE